MFSGFIGREVSKGQSAIEYLTTYGWMLVVVAVVGGAIFSVIQSQGGVEAVSGLSDSKIEVTDFGVTSEGNLQMRVRAAASEDVTVNEVKISDPSNNTLKTSNSSQISVPIGASDTITLSNVERSEGSNTYDLSVIYDAGGLTDLEASGQIQGPIKIVQVVIEKLLTSGGEMESLDIQSSLRSGDGTPICIGEGCSSTSGSELSGTEKYVNRSGDNMTGTLQTDSIDFNCLGNNCSISTGSLEGYVNTENNSMDGTLNTTEVKPVNAPVCLGETC
ncbi:hypothetical protein [Candidatus Nanohalobium constans]|uniref:Uncharacterized protein n=1 Tax=Candidatus Nanohalobium constans TaxID=2565781 RepID=A0A5Q0UH72_9ARCH|nr:hypothetical protein [Candidatus Nanohalobium constans]QGA80305.1 hypothetical protein LC1Nh_0404 [Candidatus Nanohalobium constans]